MGERREDLDRLLVDFLERDNRARASGFTIEALHAIVRRNVEALEEHAKEDERHREKVHDEFRSVRERLESGETNVNKVREKVEGLKDDLRELRKDVIAVDRDMAEITGSHEVPHEKEHTFSPTLVKYIVWAAFVAGGGGLGALVHALSSGH